MHASLCAIWKSILPGQLVQVPRTPDPAATVTVPGPAGGVGGAGGVLRVERQQSGERPDRPRGAEYVCAVRSRVARLAYAFPGG